MYTGNAPLARFRPRIVFFLFFFHIALTMKRIKAPLVFMKRDILLVILKYIWEEKKIASARTRVYAYTDAHVRACISVFVYMCVCICVCVYDGQLETCQKKCSICKVAAFQGHARDRPSTPLRVVADIGCRLNLSISSWKDCCFEDLSLILV